MTGPGVTDPHGAVAEDPAGIDGDAGQDGHVDMGIGM